MCYSNRLNLAVSDFLVVYQEKTKIFLTKRDPVEHKRRGEFINESELVSFWFSHVYDRCGSVISLVQILVSFV